MRPERVSNICALIISALIGPVAAVGLAGCATPERLERAAASSPGGGRSAAPQAGGGGSVPGRSPAPAAADPGATVGRMPAPPAGGGGPVVALPPPNGGLDYQLGGAYSPAPDVAIVSRDRTDQPAAGRYSICYVNGFQTQPGERAWWLAQHPDLVLRNSSGAPIVDPDWPDELILDISTPANRTSIASIVGPWIDGCAVSGFQAVEIDNLDTYERFPARLTEADAIAMAAAYVARAHAAGLAIAQKNAADLVARRADTGFDFAVVEQCGEFDECGVFTGGYGSAVLVIEYQSTSFATVCAAFPQLSVVLRDRNLVRPGEAGYVRQAC